MKLPKKIKRAKVQKTKNKGTQKHKKVIAILEEELERAPKNRRAVIQQLQKDRIQKVNLVTIKKAESRFK